MTRSSVRAILTVEVRSEDQVVLAKFTVQAKYSIASEKIRFRFSVTVVVIFLVLVLVVF